MRIGLAWILALSFVAFAIAAFSGASCVTSSDGATNCMASFPNDAGPTAVCAISFQCDVGLYDMTCVPDQASPGNYSCQCGTDQTTTGTRFNTNSFPCIAESAIVAANAGCGWALSLPE